MRKYYADEPINVLNNTKFIFQKQLSGPMEFIKKTALVYIYAPINLTLIYIEYIPN